MRGRSLPPRYGEHLALVAEKTQELARVTDYLDERCFSADLYLEIEICTSSNGYSEDRYVEDEVHNETTKE